MFLDFNYKTKSFEGMDDRPQILYYVYTILNVPRRSKTFDPEYGNAIGQYRFTLIHNLTTSVLASDIRETLESINGLTVTKLEMDASQPNRAILFRITFTYNGETYNTGVLTFSDGRFI